MIADERENAGAGGAPDLFTSYLDKGQTLFEEGNIDEAVSVLNLALSVAKGM